MILISSRKYAFRQGDKLYSVLLKGLGGRLCVDYAGLIRDTSRSPYESFSMCSALFDYEIRTNPKEWLVPALSRHLPETIELEVVDGQKIAPEWDESNAYMHISTGQLENAFCTFYQSCSGKLRQKYGAKINFPPEIQFCRIIRNGIAHGNSINITDGLSGTLNGTTISAAQNGKSLTYNLVTQADLVFLMMILDAE